jgi:CubicO group peptidase (beta-lactamase class C family)
MDTTLTGSVFLLTAVASAQAAEVLVFPREDWLEATPASQGIDAGALDRVAGYASKRGGGSGCVTRHGYLVKEWGDRAKLADIKSATKGTFGTTCLGLAVADGLVRLDDPAQQHYSAIGAEKPENIATGWLGEITVRQLATMTAGFDDGRPPLLAYRPGTSGIYSNDTANMLAELLTLRFGEDLTAVMKRRIMDPIGAPANEWCWRDNSYRPRTIGGLKSREFASGITVTHRTLARIGYLYLRGGNWNGKQLLPTEFVPIATQPAGGTVPWTYYGFYWGTNGNGDIGGLPRDTYWALGLGDSFVVVCPSLDVVAVRLGTGSKASQLPGDDNWGERVAGFFRQVVEATDGEANR